MPFEQHRKVRVYSESKYYAGIDGEGQGRSEHRYVMLAWSSEDRRFKGAIEAPSGGRLSTVECLDFILGIPNRAKLFAYAFNYDLTKILTDVDDRTLYRLFRPELRQSKPIKRRDGKYFNPPSRPVEWGKYRLNYQGAKFTLSCGKEHVVIWDVFRFFQSKFTKALEDWFSRETKGSDGKKTRHWFTPEMGPIVEHMRLMKDKRAQFDELSREQILAYCHDECAYMAELAHKLTEAHRQAGLHLRAYYGAGSTASAILKKLGIDRHKRATPEKMFEPVASAFFGGRFENLVLGDVAGPIWGYDISSAYPYQLTFLPCLECGEWRLTHKRSALEGARAACVRYSLGTPPKGINHWGPFPFRLKNGSIAFPSTSGGGWIWGDEFLAAETLFPHVQFHEAWIYHTDCTHQPFGQIPKYYLERLRIGKEGPGIVIKLGCNACYGKLVQSLGLDPPFQCWIWGGMITSGTRAQILQMLGMHTNRANMLMVATDGIYSREKLDPPKPRYTGTGIDDGAVEPKDGKLVPVNKPLGGWERKIVEAGMFAARPGIYFPLNPTLADIENMRARGVGRSILWESWQSMVEAYRTGLSGCKIAKVSRFQGAKSSIGRKPIPGMPGQYQYTRWLDEETKRPRYGEWTARVVDLSFNPLPKRDGMAPDNTLAIRAFPGEISLPYKRTSLTEQLARKLLSQDMADDESIALKLATIEALEQPDGDDFSDYEEGA